jgi:hypothetical protein
MVSEFAAEGTKTPYVMVTCGLHGYSLSGFVHIKIESSNISKK